MLMNGKEVNHLVIGGEMFDKNYCMRRIRFLKNFASYDGRISPEGVVMGSGNGGMGVEKGNIGYTILKYKNGYCACVDNGFKIGFWVTEDCIEFINDTTGGVNSPLYLLLFYCCIALLAWEVAFLC